MQWDIQNQDYDEYPPEPRFNSGDNQQCIYQVEEFYEQAYETHERELQNIQQLNDSYQAILDGQERYGVELVNNQEFANWLLVDYPESRCFVEGQLRPAFPISFIETFGDDQTEVAPLRNIDQVEEAVTKVFNFRLNLCLEELISIPPFLPFALSDMCSKATQDLAQIYVNHI